MLRSTFGSCGKAPGVLVAFGAWLTLARCGGGAAPGDASVGVDARREASVGDVSDPDRGAPADATVEPDASSADATVDRDAARSDAATDARADAGRADAGPDARESCTGRLFCDDFERYPTGAPPPTPWRSSPTNGRVTVESARTYSGSRAVHVHTDAGTFKSALISLSGTPVFPLPGNAVYGRMMLYAASAANDGVHWTLIHADGPLAGSAGVNATYNYGGQWMGRLMANYYANSRPAFDCWDHSATVMPVGRWTCYEWRFDGPRSEMRLWVDGTEITDVHIANRGEGCVGMTGSAYPWTAPTFQRMAVGWESYQSDPARDAWVDDVVLDDVRVGCPAPR